MKLSRFDKRGFEFSFGWLFSIIVGVAIIVLAIYAASKFVYTERTIQDTEYAKELGILLNPLETGLEEAKKAEINFPVETRIHNSCVRAGSRVFGEQKIAISTKSGVGKEWQRPGVNSSFYNKYLFSSSTVEGETFYVLSKPFNMPFKVADLSIIWSDKEEYCFVNPSNEIEEEVSELNLKGINISGNLRDCPRESRKVCFSSIGCDIDVNLQGKTVKNKGKTVYYEDSLLFAAIFSDPQIYECQIQRLMKRASELSLIYLGKSEYIAAGSSGCGSNLQGLLISYTNQSLIEKSSDLSKVAFIANELEERNEAISNCKIF